MRKAGCPNRGRPQVLTASLSKDESGGDFGLAVVAAAAGAGESERSNQGKVPGRIDSLAGWARIYTLQLRWLMT